MKYKDVKQNMYDKYHKWFYRKDERSNYIEDCGDNTCNEKEMRSFNEIDVECIDDETEEAYVCAYCFVTLK